MIYQRITTSDENSFNATTDSHVTESLEQSMKIVAMEGYPGSLRMNRPPVDANLSQIQGYVSVLMENIQELTTQRLGHP
jgi:hypothetical protein